MRPTAIRDDLLPALTELLGPGARSVVSAGVQAAGGELVDLRRSQVLYRPGRRASVRFTTTVRWAGGPPVEETIVAMVAADGPPDGTLVVRAGDLAVGLFRYPDDPGLPGLRPAVFSADVADRLRVPAETVQLDVRTYRPGRRAVVRVGLAGASPGVATSSECYLKVVPPAELGALVDRLAALEGHVPVPRVLDTWADDGVAVLAAMPGRTIRDILLAGDPDEVDRLPDGDVILALLDRLPAGTGASAMAGIADGPLSRARAHAGLLASVLPAERDRLEALVGRLGHESDIGPVVPTHGDLHDAQILIEGGEVAGVIDVDGAGPGRRVNDLATMLGHLVTLGDANPRRRASIVRWRRRLEPAFEGAVGQAELRRTTAAALVGMATGPFRTQRRGWRRGVLRGIDAAETWAAAAGA